MIRDRVWEIGQEIQRTEAYASEGLTVLIVLKGAFVFASDLIRQLKTFQIRLGFVLAESYKGAAAGELRVDLSLLGNAGCSLIEGQHVLIVEDIYDSGNTLFHLNARIAELRPKTLRNCVLLRKQVVPRYEVPLDFVGFPVPDVFVVGYGMDYDGLYRHKPFVAELPKEHRSTEL